MTDAKEDAERLREIARKLTYNNQLQGPLRSQLITIAARLERDGYSTTVANVLADGYDGSVCTGAEDGPGAISLHYSMCEKAEAAHDALCALIDSANKVK